MELKNSLEKKEIQLLKDVGIKIKEREYSIDEIGEIIEKLDNIIRSNLDENDNFTQKSLEYEAIQDKIINYESNL